MPPKRPQPPLLLPNRKVTMARFGAPHGVRGLLRLHVFSRQPDFFTTLPVWWCLPPQANAELNGNWQTQQIERCYQHSGNWLVKLSGVDDRDAAALWCHGYAAVEYQQLPAVESDTYYWCDLIGLSVQTIHGETLGEVSEIMDIGAHDVLCIADETDEKILIPFVEKYVLTVDIAQQLIQVDWQRDW